MSVRLAALLVGVAALALSLALPWARHYGEKAEAEACSIAVAEAQRRVDIACAGGELAPPAARRAAVGGSADWEERWAALCPAGGDAALVRDGENGGYRVVCPLHTADDVLRTRLNASNAEERLAGALEGAARRGEAVPETVTVTLNGKPFAITRAEAEPDIARGTLATPGYDGVVAYFGAEDGKVLWFCYADEQHCAAMRADEGWRMDGGVRAS